MPSSFTTRLGRWSAWMFGGDIAARVIAPLLADWAHERERASPIRRRVLTLRWMAALARTVACLAWRHATPGWRAARAMTAFSLAGTTLLIAPFVTRLPPGASRIEPLLLYLTPQALALAVPFAMLPVAMLLGASAAGAAAGRLRRQLMTVTAAVLFVTVTSLAWVVPAANQAFRETTRAAMGFTGGPLVRGVRELGPVDLWQARGVEPVVARRELRAKLAIGFAWPLALSVLGWRLGRHRGSSGVGAMAFWWILAALMIGAVDPTRHYGRELPVLLPPLLWLAAGVALRPSTSAVPGPRLGRQAPPRSYFFFGL